MDADGWSKIIASLVSLIQALSWPLLVLFIIVKFATPFRNFLDNLGEFTFKAGATGLEATAKRQQIEAAALLGIASANKSGAGTITPATTESLRDAGEESVFSGGPGGAPSFQLGEAGQPPIVSPEDKAREIANAVNQAVTPKSARNLAQASVLWVDDNPNNNIYEKKALEALGIRFSLSASTEDALQKLRVGKYDAIISDMGRGPDPKAGYALLEEKKQLGDTTPLIIFASSSTPERKAESRRRGAFGNTNNPQELFQLVISAIQNK